MSQELKDLVIVEKPNLYFESEDGSKLRILSEEDEAYLESKMQEMITYMRENHSQDYDEQKKDEVYGHLQQLWEEVSGKDGGRLNEISFNLILYRDEYTFITSLIKNKMEYNVDTVFYAIELRNMIAEMMQDNKYTSDTEIKAFNMTPVDVHYLYHIISKHTVKGLSKEALTFAEVIRRIALSSNVFNYYKENFNNIAKAIQLWTASLDEGVTIPENDKVYQLIWGDSDVKPTFRSPSEKEQLVEEGES